MLCNNYCVIVIFLKYFLCQTLCSMALNLAEQFLYKSTSLFFGLSDILPGDGGILRSTFLYPVFDSRSCFLVALALLHFLPLII
jgi:hypothetical protein